MEDHERIAQARTSLKITLLVQQRDRCAYCGERKPWRGMQFHHTLFRESRGKTTEQKLALLSPMNGRLVCPECHVPEPPDLDLICCKRLIEQFGADNIEEWAGGLGIRDTSLDPAYWKAKEEPCA